MDGTLSKSPGWNLPSSISRRSAASVFDSAQLTARSLAEIRKNAAGCGGNDNASFATASRKTRPQKAVSCLPFGVPNERRNALLEMRRADWAGLVRCRRGACRSGGRRSGSTGCSGWSRRPGLFRRREISVYAVLRNFHDHKLIRIAYALNVELHGLVHVPVFFLDRLIVSDHSHREPVVLRIGAAKNDLNGADVFGLLRLR